MARQTRIVPQYDIAPPPELDNKQYEAAPPPEYDPAPPPEQVPSPMPQQPSPYEAAPPPSDTVDVAPPQPQQPESSGIFDTAKKIWEEGNRPLLRLGHTSGGLIKRENFKRDYPRLGAVSDFAGDVLEGLTSKYGIASTIGLAGQATTGKIGFQLLNKILAAPLVGEGTYKATTGDTWGQRVGGLAEFAMGTLGAKGKLTYRASVADLKAAAEAAAAARNAGPKVPPIKLNFKNMEKIAEGMYKDSAGNIFDVENKRVIMGDASAANTKMLESKDYVPGGVIEEGEYKGRAFRVHASNIVEDLGKQEHEPFMEQLWNLPRGLESVDLPYSTSAAFRQGLPLIWAGHGIGSPKNWLTSWVKAAKAFNSEEAANIINSEIRDKPLFKQQPKLNWNAKTGEWVRTYGPSQAEEMGLRMSELDGAISAREEAIRGQMAEKLPFGIGRYVRASNRSYNAFLNNLRAQTFEDLYKYAEITGKLKENPKLGNELAEFINNATGKGTIGVNVGGKIPEYGFSGRIAKSIAPELAGKKIGIFKDYDSANIARVFSDVFFSPRMMFSRWNMLNPTTYLTASPFARRQYLKAAAATGTAWMSFALLMEKAVPGATVSWDMDSADFAKVKIGNMRLDPGAGFQQTIVLLHRIMPSALAAAAKMVNVDLPRGGWTTTERGAKHRTFGQSQGVDPQTEWDTIVRYFANKTHPNLKMGYDIFNATDKAPVYMWDRTIQQFLPLVLGDAVDVAKEDPSLLPLAIPFGGMGGSTQVYEGKRSEPTFTPLVGLDKIEPKWGKSK